MLLQRPTGQGHRPDHNEFVMDDELLLRLSQQMIICYSDAA